MFEGVGAAYLEQLLEAATDGEVARREAAGGRIVASLILALVAQGGADRVERFLRRVPDLPATYEVACFNREDRPAARVECLEAGTAIRLAVGLATARPDGSVAVLAHDGAGTPRCVLLANGSTLTFQFAGAGEVDRIDRAPLETVAYSPLADESVADEPVADEPVAGDGVWQSPYSTESAEIEELTRYVNDQLGSDLYGPGGDLVRVLGSVIPSAAEIAELVVNRLSENPDLAETQLECERRSAKAVANPRRRRSVDTPQGPGSSFRG